MNHNWNVYKVFSSGKRAKSPYYSFVYEDENNVEKYFLEKKLLSWIQGILRKWSSVLSLARTPPLVSGCRETRGGVFPWDRTDSGI